MIPCSRIPGAAAWTARSRLTRESSVRVSECVTGLLKNQPFFGSLALRLPLRPDPSRKTLACDGKEIRFSPHWVADQDAHLVQTAIARVVLACALKHHTRRDDRQPERWQHASQLVTHSILRDSGFTLPPDAEAWDGLSVEEACERLLEEEQDGSGSNGESPASVTAGSDASADEVSSPPDSSGSDGSDDQQPNGSNRQTDSDDDDSESPGAPPPASHDPSGTGEVMDAQSQEDDGSSNEPFDVTQEEQDWDQAMHQASSIARAEGNLPGSVEDTVNDAHRSSLDWKELLRRHMIDCMRRDYSWSAPIRRFIDQGIYLPSIRSDGIETVALIIDTSISIWPRPEVLSMFWTEIREIASEISPKRIFVLQVDTVLQQVEEFSSDDLPGELVLKGKGGTDFRPGFEWLNDENIQPGVCVYFTDMECIRYPEEPPFPVIWCDLGQTIVGHLPRALG